MIYIYLRPLDLSKKNQFPKELIIISSHRIFDTIGGVEKFVSMFSNWCQSKRINVTVLSRSLSLKSIRITHGPIKMDNSAEISYVKKIQIPFLFYYLGLLFFSIAAFINLLILIKQKGAQRRAFVMHAQDINFAALSAVLAGFIYKVPVVIHQHGPYQNLLPSRNMQILEQAVNRFTCRLASIIITTDVHSSNYLRQLTDESKILILPAAIDLKEFALKNQQKKIGTEFRIGYIGRLSAEKNVDILIKAFKEIKELHNCHLKLFLVGDGALRGALENLVNQLSLSGKVVFTGFRRDIKPILATFDIFILPSKIEGTPISLLEAMAAGKAIVCSDIPSLSEIVVHGKEALLFEVNNPYKLASAIQVLYLDANLRNELGRNALKKVTRFSTDEIFIKILRCYERIGIGI